MNAIGSLVYVFDPTKPAILDEVYSKFESDAIKEFGREPLIEVSRTFDPVERCWFYSLVARAR